MDGKTILVTGATSGIGLAAALALGGLGAHVLLHGRDLERVHEAAEGVRHATGALVDEWVADLASAREIRRMAAGLLDHYPRLDVLANNAGVYMPQRVLTADGYETTFAVNYLAPFLLTQLLVPRLQASAPSRVVNVASKVHLHGRLQFEDLQGARGYDGYDAYAQSKLALVLFTLEQAGRLAGTGVTVNCLHPGTVDTKLLHAGFRGHHGSSPAQGADTLVYLALSSEMEGVTGRYFEDRHPVEAAPPSRDPELRRRLWKVSQQLVGTALDG